MLVYDAAYNSLRSKYIVPLTDYSIRYDSLKKNNIKEILVSKFISVQKDSDGDLLFTFEQDVLLKALLGDIQLFFIRTKIQKIDATTSANVNFSSNWNIVTHYYFGFFCASLLLRLCFKGNIFLDDKMKRELEKLVSQVLGEVIKLDSNQFYEVVIANSGEYVLKLSKANANTHEVVWKKVDALLDEMLLITRKKSDEELVLKAIKNMNYSLSNTFPSKLRNAVNYQSLYGLKYLNNSLYPIDSNISWLRNLIHYQKMRDDNQVASAMYSYICYLEILCDNLMSEYFKIRGNQNGLIKNINKKCNNAIHVPNIRYVFEL